MDDRRSVPAPDSGVRPPSGGAEEPPPILGRWRALYAVVIGELLLVIAFCAWLSTWQR
jgi:hypothetical protein